MVKPYLSRLRPTESGQLRPRPRSRFEPTPRFPIDGPAIGPSTGPDLPPTWDAAAADAEIELDRDAPHPHPADPALTRAALGEQELPPARTAAPGPAARDTERAPGRAARPAGPPPQTLPAITTTTSEIELDRDAAYPHPGEPAPTQAAPGEQGLPPARTAAPGPAARDTGLTPGRAARLAGPPPQGPPVIPATTSEIELDRDAAYPHPGGLAPTQAAPGEQGLPPVRTAAPGPAARDTERTPGRAARPAGPSPQSAQVILATPSESHHRPASVGNERAGLPTPSAGAGGEHTRAPSSTAQRPARSSTAQGAARSSATRGAAPWSATQQPAPWPRHAPPEQAPPLGDRAGRRRGAEPIPSEPAPPERLPLAPHRHLDRASNPADAPADRVQAMARWLRDVDAETAAKPSISPRSAAMDPEVTVTIGRIEVKAPAANPAPAGPQPGGPRRRVPSLGDYLESRTRVRGRPG